MKKNKKRNSAKKKEKSAGISSARLIFPPAPGQNDGFTASSSSSFLSDPASCVRELVQNALDSALVAAKKKTAEVRFVIEECETNYIPGIVEYKAALADAKKQRHAQNELSKSIAEDISACAQEKKVKMLFVMDNGVGFDRERLEAMLSDGFSVQPEKGSRGAFGNGHLTAFALSKLRYIFYGGIRQNGDRIFSGHALLASHTGKVRGNTCVLNREGYYVRKIREDSLFDCFDFVGKEDEPMFLREKMEQIAKDWESGAVIAITAFNDFNGDDEGDVADIILRQCAFNFYAAIYEGQLRVEVSYGGKKRVLDRSDLPNLLSENKDKTRGRDNFPSGRRIWNSYDTLTAFDEPIQIALPAGNVKLFLRQGGDEKGVALCRNGMWISGNIPMLQRHNFGDRKSFDALILVDAEDGGDVHDLIRLAETQLHNEIKVSNLKKKKAQSSLRGIFEAIREEIKKRVEQKSDESFSADDFFPIEYTTKVGAGDRPSGRSLHTTKISGRAAGDSAGRKGKRSGKKREFSRSGKAVDVNYSVRRVAEGKMRAIFASQEDCEDVEMRLSLDGGEDITCASTAREQLRLLDVRVGGETIPQESMLKNENGAVMGARLGAWEKDKRYDVEIDYEPPSSGNMHTVVFDLLRRKPRTEEEAKNARD